MTALIIIAACMLIGIILFLWACLTAPLMADDYDMEP